MRTRARVYSSRIAGPDTNTPRNANVLSNRDMQPKDNHMRILLLAAAVALALGTGSAFAGEGGDAPATTAFTIAADQLAHRATQEHPGKTMDRPSGSKGINAARTRDLGTWLFPPSEGGGSR
jgi:hypothetical protein